MVFSGENDDGYVSGGDNLQQEDRQQDLHEADRLQNEEELKRQQEQKENEQEKQAEIEAETERNRDASEKTAEHEEALSDRSEAKASNIEELVQGDPGNLGEDLQGIIAKLAKTGVKSADKSNSRGAGLDGMKKQGAGAEMSGPDGNDDGNDPSKDGGSQGASR